MKLSEKQERWIKQLEELWNFFDARLKNYSLKTSNLRFFLLLTMTVASHRLIRGFLAQLRGGSNDNLESKLRTLMETAINIHYILGDETDDRAKAYILNGAASRVNALDKIIELLEQKKAEAWAAINSTEGYKELRKEKQQGLSDLKARFGVENYSWPKIELRARAQGLEELYTTIFWYFSEDTHMTSSGLDRFLWWYQKSRQFLGKNKTKLNCSRNPRLPFQIHLCWCVIVKRLMQALMIVKREIFT